MLMGLRRQSRYLPGAGRGRGLAWEEETGLALGVLARLRILGLFGGKGWLRVQAFPTAILSGFEIAG